MIQQSSKHSKVVLDADGYPKIEMASYKCQNGLELVLCQVNNPLYAAYVSIPTFIADDKGLPHTLEHLIFCGSSKYPERGYLDRLATLCQGHGTNAYTAEDHTCYTFNTSSLAGLLRLLPVFLDHIFCPTIEPTLVQREVFHRDEQGEGKGVVYCEMGGREWSEQDQLDLALRRAIFATTDNDNSNDCELDGYRWECGGLTKELVNLTRDEIIAYHQKYYNSNNAVIFLSGGVELTEKATEILKVLEALEFNNQSTPSEPLSSISNNISEKKIEKIVHPVELTRELLYPANDESLGSIGFGWRGPPSDELFTITALHILMRMLKETSASPLYQYFVEKSDPVASDIDYEIKPYYTTMITLIFSGIPTDLIEFDNEEEQEEDNGLIDFLTPFTLCKMMMDFIKNWLQDEQAIKDRLKVVIEAIKIKFQESLEDDPHDVCASYCMPEIVRAHWPRSNVKDEKITYGQALVDLPHHFDILAKKPSSFWVDLAEEYLFKRPVYEVRMRPSKEMATSIKEKEIEQLKNIPKIDLNPEGVAFSLIPIPSFELELPKVVDCEFKASGSLALTIVPNSKVKRLSIAFDLSSSLSKDLWPCLVLFQELIFQSDLEVTKDILSQFNSPESITPIGHIPYQTLIEKLSSQFLLFEAAIGFDNELFSIGYLDSHLVVSIHGRVPYNMEQMVAFIMTILAATKFTIERVDEILENLVSQLKDNWRDPSNVLDGRLIEILNADNDNNDNNDDNDNNDINDGDDEQSSKRRRKSFKQSKSINHIEQCIGLSRQSEFLYKAKQLLEDDPDTLFEMLETIRTTILQSNETNSIINFGEASSDDKESCKHQTTVSSCPLPYSLPKYGHLQSSLVNPNGKVEVLPMSDITASFMTIVLPINILPANNVESSLDELHCIALLCQLISYTEGPLYRRIRGAGLAYGASMSIAVWNGLLSFDLSDSIDPVKSLIVIQQLVKDILTEANAILNDDFTRKFDILNEETLKTAKAVQLYQFVAERSTSAAMVSTAFRCYLRNLPVVGSKEEELSNTRLLKQSLKDIAKVISYTLPAFLDNTKTIKLLTIPSGKVDSISKDFESANIDYIVNDYVTFHSLE